MSGAILMSTVGSWGDLFPVLAVARALHARDVDVRLALAPEDAAVAQSAGIPATSVGPTQADIARHLGLSPSEIARQFFRNPSPLLREVIYPASAEVAAEILPLTKGVTVIAGTTLALAAPMVAEALGVNFVALDLQPLHMRSVLRPPRVLGFSPPMLRNGTGSVRSAWNRTVYRAIYAEMRRRHALDQKKMRNAFGLPNTTGIPIFETGSVPIARLGLWDPRFAPALADAPANLEITGFPFWSQNTSLPTKLERFLDQGPAPLVISLGSIAQSLRGLGFYKRLIRAARHRGIRVVALTGADIAVPEAADVCTLPFAPHELLFPKARAVVHHGGIGTTTQALRAGIPQLIAPLGADQPDNAAYVVSLGLGKRLWPWNYRAALDAVLSEGHAERALKFGQTIKTNGAERAAEALQALARHSSA